MVKVIDDRMYMGQRFYVYKCFFGSSTMNTKEMGGLIDKTIERAEAVGIDTDYWKEVLYESEGRNS